MLWVIDMKTSEFLKIVKRDYLARSYKEYSKNENKQRFLCLAIEHVGEELKESFKADNLMVRIQEALEGKHTVEAWLVANGYVEGYVPRRDNAVFKYRHRWIDSLIEEYEAKGD